ncbi:MAG TPA: HlyC/CorC family transporter [Candidatus Hydrogenedentes bacterium]|nr:HlyC/CorC family transporter [Candidatus Hydrogenedentota bacterium]
MMFSAIAIFIACAILNAFLSGYETGFVSANLIRIRNMAEKERKISAMRLLAHYENPARIITTLLIGANLSLVIGTTALTRELGPGMATIIATPVFVIFAEIMPKSIFRHFPTRLIVFFFPVVRFFEGMLAIITIPVAWAAQRFLMLGDEEKGMRMFLTSLEDMRVLVDESHEQGTLDPDEHEMIHSVIDLQTQCANEVMVPRIQIQALPETATTQELKTMLIESGRTRLPVYSESIDHIVGVVNAFDVIKDASPGESDIRRFIKPILHVPDSMKLDDVLKALRDAHQSMAIVTDEYGGTDGLITVEDILEEIFGEIHDEYDIMTTQIKKVGPRAFVVDANTALEDLAAAIGVDIKDEEVETAGGWLNHIAGHIPAKGEVILHEPFRITVLEGQPSHVSSIRLEIILDERDETDVKEQGT